MLYQSRKAITNVASIDIYCYSIVVDFYIASKSSFSVGDGFHTIDV